MKHIKRKFLLTCNITNDGYEYLLQQKTSPKALEKLSDKNFVPHLLTTDQKYIQSFFYELEGIKVPIPEPNPIVIYFSNAQGFLSIILKTRIELFKELKTIDYSVGDILNHMFAFYGCVVNFTSSLFDALEGFVNSKIPKDYKCKNPNRRNELMNKYQIIRYSTFESKVKIILPEIFPNKNFAKDKSHFYENIILLKKLRDNITHAKADIEYDVNYYEKLFTETLDFDFLKAIESAKELINFYETDLIEPCECGQPH